MSKNSKKAKAEVQRIHARIANVRLDFLHKTSTPISKNHAMVVMENCRVEETALCFRLSLALSAVSSFVRV